MASLDALIKKEQTKFLRMLGPDRAIVNDTRLREGKMSDLGMDPHRSESETIAVISIDQRLDRYGEMDWYSERAQEMIAPGTAKQWTDSVLVSANVVVPAQVVVYGQKPDFRKPGVTNGCFVAFISRDGIDERDLAGQDGKQFTVIAGNRTLTMKSDSGTCTAQVVDEAGARVAGQDLRVEACMWTDWLCRIVAYNGRESLEARDGATCNPPARR